MEAPAAGRLAVAVKRRCSSLRVPAPMTAGSSHALVDAGANPDDRNPDGETPLHTAIRSGGQSEKPKVVEALLAAGADPCIRDASGYIPYSTAREGGAVHTMLANAGGYDRACDDAPEIVEADQRMQASKRPTCAAVRARTTTGWVFWRLATRSR